MDKIKKLRRYLIIVKQDYVRHSEYYVGPDTEGPLTGTQSDKWKESAAPIIVGEGNFESPEAALAHHSKYNAAHTLTVREIPRNFRPFTPEEAFAMTDRAITFQENNWVCTFSVTKLGQINVLTTNKSGNPTLIFVGLPLDEAPEKFTFDDGSYFGVEDNDTDSIWKESARTGGFL